MKVWGTAADVVRASLNPVVNTGAWNMDVTDLVDVDTGYHYSKWRHVCVMILNNAGDEIKRLGWKGSLSGWWHHDPAKGDTIITLERKVGGDFDGLDYNNAVMNRGYIKMALVP